MNLYCPLLVGFCLSQSVSYRTVHCRGNFVVAVANVWNSLPAKPRSRIKHIYLNCYEHIWWIILHYRNRCIISNNNISIIIIRCACLCCRNKSDGRAVASLPTTPVSTRRHPRSPAHRQVQISSQSTFVWKCFIGRFVCSAVPVWKTNIIFIAFDYVCWCTFCVIYTCMIALYYIYYVKSASK